MTIVENQHNGKQRTYHLPDHQREAWHDFFNWLVQQGHIETWEESDSKI